MWLVYLSKGYKEILGMSGEGRVEEREAERGGHSKKGGRQEAEEKRRIQRNKRRRKERVVRKWRSRDKCPLTPGIKGTQAADS